MNTSRTVSVAGIIALAALSIGAFFVSTSFAHADDTPTTGAVTAITSSTATLNGSNGGSAADAGGEGFWYGTTATSSFTADFSATVGSQIPAGWLTSLATSLDLSSNGVFSLPITSLTPDTTYYYVAWSEVADFWTPGLVQHFQTLNGPVVSSVDSNGKTFDGGNHDIEVTFENDVVTAPSISVTDGGAQVVGDCGDSDAKTFCFTYNATTQATETITISGAVDAGNTTMSTDSTHTFLVDLTPPTLSTVSIASNNTNPAFAKVGDVVTVTFTASEAIQTPVVSIDGHSATIASGSGSGPYTATYTMTSGDTEGAVSFTIDSTDIAGNVGTQVTLTTDASSVTFDMTPPAVPSTPVLDSASDSGSSNSDGITNVTTPEFTGTADAGTTVTLYDTNGTTVLGTTTADGSGNWSITSTALSEGSHTITAKATDAASNQSSASSGVSVTIDTIDPTVLQVTAVPTPTNNSAPSYTFSSTENGTAAYGGKCSTTATSSVSSGNTTVVLATTGDQSYNNCTVTVTDTAGNAGSVAINSFLLDTQAPIITSVAYSPTNGTIAIGDILTLTIHADSAGYTAGPITVNSEPVSGFVDNGDTTYTAYYTVASGDHDWTNSQQIPVSVVLTDEANNSNAAFTTAPVAGQTPAVDAHAPAAPSTPVLDASTDSGVLGDNITSITTPLFTGTAEVGSTVTLFDGNTLIGSYLASGGTWAITSTALSEGLHSSIGAIATDAVGNISATSSLASVTIDTTAPAAPSALTLDPSTDSGVSGDDITNFRKPTITGTAEVGSTVTLYNGLTILGTGTADGSGNWSITSISNLSSGPHTLTATATDAAGNTGAASTGLVVTIDHTAPTLHQVTAVTTPTNSVTTYPYVFSSSEAGTIAYGGDCSSVTTSASSGNNAIAFNNLADGTHSNCTISVTDAAGNQSSSLNVSSFRVDTVPPTVALTSTVGSLTNAPFSVTFTFSETVVGFTASDITVTNGSVGTLTGSGTVRHVTVTPTTDGPVTVTVHAGVAQDNAGNPNLAGNTISTTYDHTAPTLTAVSIASNNSSTTLAKVGDTVTLSFTASEAITTPVVTIDGVAATVSGSGPYTATHLMSSADATGPVTFTVNFADLATNVGAQVTSTTNASAVIFDKTAPTVVVTTSDADGIVNASTSVTILATFSEPVQNSPVPTITISGADTLAATAMTMTDSTHYTYAYIASSTNGTATFTVDGAQDLSGNAQTASSTTLILDNTAPVITILGNNPDNVFASNSGSYNDAGATALDSVDGNVNVTSTSNVTLSPAGTYTITYSATDAAGNTSTSSRTVIVTAAGNGPTSGGGGGGGGGGNGPIALPNNGGAPNTNTGGGSGSGGTGQVLGASTYNFTVNFGLGAKGADVTQLQTILIADGYLKIDGPTGYFGQGTFAALKLYQAAHGIIPASGYVGPKTRAILNAGVTPTITDEQKAQLLLQLQNQLKAILAQLAAATSSNH